MLPAIIIHLERGSCHSGINEIDLNQSAAMCFQWKYLVDMEWRDELLERKDLDKYNAPRPFVCPGCDSEFRYLSGLFMHVASPACNQSLESTVMEKLIHWLKNRHQL